MSQNEMDMVTLSKVELEWMILQRVLEARSVACEECGRLRKALMVADKQLAIARRFFPSHGSFGEEGISNYENAQARVRAALSTSTEEPKP